MAAFATYSSTQSSYNLDGLQSYQPNYIPFTMSQENESDDPVRLARNDWVIRHTDVSDSSAIIDSIDVDMIDAHQDEASTEIYLVLDTNILIHHLTVLKQALNRIEAPNSGLNVVLLVPGIVVSELDYQKNSARGIALESRRASDWLAGEIGSGRGRVKGQAYSQTMLPSGDWRQRLGLTNDELILDCCKYFGHIKRKDVLLCTRDNNLTVQASSNAENLFLRGVLAVVRPSREFWDCNQLLEKVVPGFNRSSAASIHASGASRENRANQMRDRLYSHAASTDTSYHALTLHAPSVTRDDAVMEIDMDGDPLATNRSSQTSAGDRRDQVHRQMAYNLGQHLRKLTGEAAGLQQQRRAKDSRYSPENAKFTGNLPSETDWSQTWTLRECLKFVAKIPPLHPRSWTFGDGEVSSLADFLGLPGERGARPGREWAKYDWGTKLEMVKKLAQDFNFEELDYRQMAEYEYEVMDMFAVD